MKQLQEMAEKMMVSSSTEIPPKMTCNSRKILLPYQFLKIILNVITGRRLCLELE